jgi:DNA/RNA endonuclease YhcR with UshA esterase domain
MRDEVVYDGAKEGRSYTLNNRGVWLWTDHPTPGEAAVASVGNAVALGKVSGTRVATTLDQALSLKSGQKASIEGVVAVLPGVYGTQYFYVISPDSGVGMQIYMNKKNFPLIKIGDLVHATGIMGTGPQGPRLKVTATSDIKALAHDVDVVPPKQTISDIDEQMVGQLIQISGEITDIKTSYLYLDDGTGEFKIYKKTGAHITFDRFHQGDNITATGILGKSANEIQLWPRGQRDLSTLGASDGVANTAATTSTFFAGAGSVAYAKATAGGMAAIMTGLALRSRVGGRMSRIRLRLSSVLVRLRRVVGL